MRWLGALPQDVYAGRERAELYVCGDVAEQGGVQLVERRELPQESGGLLRRRGVERGIHGFEWDRSANDGQRSRARQRTEGGST
jgi:hypothetical protein